MIGEARDGANLWQQVRGNRCRREVAQNLEDHVETASTAARRELSGKAGEGRAGEMQAFSGASSEIGAELSGRPRVMSRPRGNNKTRKDWCRSAKRQPRRRRGRELFSLGGIMNRRAAQQVFVVSWTEHPSYKLK
ncbi:hypothetical protein NL676_022806 [Syzygium grande]|nr:hypothetical protein NL676_022806 [Syzygium grande]